MQAWGRQISGFCMGFLREGDNERNGIYAMADVVVNQYFFVHAKHAPLNCRGGCYFCLDTKVTKKSREKKASALQAILPARFSVRLLRAFRYFVFILSK